MAVRKIPKSHLFVTGSFASRKNDQMDEFESLLEKEYMLLLEFDDRVEHFETQPVTIPIPGVPRGYTPDVLVFYRPDTVSGQVPKPLLTEIKHSDDLKRNADKYATKFALADKYALERAWEFRVTNEVHIRTPRLSNLKFLREYRNIFPMDQDQARIVHIAKEAVGSLSPATLLAQLAITDDDRLYWLPIIWHSILTRQLLINWDLPLDHDAVLHLPERFP